MNYIKHSTLIGDLSTIYPREVTDSIVGVQTLQIKFTDYINSLLVVTKVITTQIQNVRRYSKSTRILTSQCWESLLCISNCVTVCGTVGDFSVLYFTGDGPRVPFLSCVYKYLSFLVVGRFVSLHSCYYYRTYFTSSLWCLIYRLSGPSRCVVYHFILRHHTFSSVRFVSVRTRFWV